MKTHPASETFPLIEGDEFGALVSDIRENGQLEPVVLLDGEILDGRNRYRACEQLGIDCKTIDANETARKDPTAFVLSMNLHRRHITATQRREIIDRYLKASPEKSNREIARSTNCNHRTVAARRKKLESGGEILHVDKRRGADGKEYGTTASPNSKTSSKQKKDAPPSWTTIHLSKNAGEAADDLIGKCSKPHLTKVVTELNKKLSIDQTQKTKANDKPNLELSPDNPNHTARLILKQLPRKAHKALVKELQIQECMDRKQLKRQAAKRQLMNDARKTQRRVETEVMRREHKTSVEFQSAFDRLKEQIERARNEEFKGETTHEAVLAHVRRLQDLADAPLSPTKEK